MPYYPYFFTLKCHLRVKIQNFFLSHSDFISLTMRGSRNFRQGGGVQVRLAKKALTLFFFSPQLILQKSNGQFQRNLSFFMVPEGVQHFPGGGPTFSRGGGGGGGGSNSLFPIETHITCDFPGGGSGPPVPPSGSALVNQCIFSGSTLQNIAIFYFYPQKSLCSACTIVTAIILLIYFSELSYF